MEKTSASFSFKKRVVSAHWRFTLRLVPTRFLAFPRSKPFIPTKNWLNAKVSETYGALPGTLFAQFNQLTLRMLVVRIQLDRPRISHTRILGIVRRLVTISQAVPCIRGIGISLCVQFEQHDR